MEDTAFSYLRGLIVCWFLQESFKVKESIFTLWGSIWGVWTRTRTALSLPLYAKFHTLLHTKIGKERLTDNLRFVIWSFCYIWQHITIHVLGCIECLHNARYWVAELLKVDESDFILDNVKGKRSGVIWILICIMKSDYLKLGLCLWELRTILMFHKDRPTQWDFVTCDTVTLLLLLWCWYSAQVAELIRWNSNIWCYSGVASVRVRYGYFGVTAAILQKQCNRILCCRS